MPRYQASELLLIALFAACIIFQLFIPPAVGLANNGDFSKMIGRFSLAPATLDTSEEYRYFTARWVYDRSFHWVSDDVSSELILIGAAVVLARPFSAHVFPIQALGAIHALLWIGCFAAFLPLLRFLTGWRRLAAGLAAVFIFTDASYAAQLNSFYTDVAGFIFLAWVLVLWLYAIADRSRSWTVFALFALASILCVSSKAQHAPLAIFLAILAISARPSFELRRQSAAALAFAALILVIAVVTIRLMPHTERESNQYHVIFMSILPKSPTPSEDARELGLSSDYLRYVGYWPQRPQDDPMENPEWHKAFTARTGFGHIALFHLRHPWRTLAIIYRTLHDQAQFRRPGLSNYEQAAGFPPGAKTKSFGWWSELRSGLFRIAPWHIVVWYAVILAAAIRGIPERKRTRTSRVYLLAMILAAMGAVELAVSALTDTGETDRHLFLFHVITDFTILLAVVWALSRLTQRTGRKGVECAGAD